MVKNKIRDALKKGKILVSDGSWGTYLQQQGLKVGECPEEWCLTHPDAVFQIAKSYIDAGSDMIQTDSFGGSRYKLEQYGLADKVTEINEASASLSRQAAEDKNWVIASMGPTGKMIIMKEVTEEDLYTVFKEQACALEKGGADAICIETMFALDEMNQAIKAVRENTACEIIATFTFDLTAKGEYRTMMGVSPAEFATTAVKAGADIIGTNCGNGMERMIEIVKELRAAEPDTPILVHANAGLPEHVNGVDIYSETPERMEALVPSLLKAGANIIGGCCGTTPDHIRSIKKVVNSMQK